MLILLIALPLLTGLAAALPFPSRRGRLTFLLTMQIIETAQSLITAACFISAAGMAS